jgi:hypothetical protein
MRQRKIAKASIISFGGKGAICIAGEVKLRVHCSSKGIGSIKELSTFFRCLKPLDVLVFSKACTNISNIF